MSRSVFSITALLALLIALFFGQWLTDAIFGASIIVFLGIISAFVLPKKWRALAIVAVFFALLGIARVAFSWHASTPSDAAFYADQKTPVEIVGWVADEPDRRATMTRLTLSVESIRNASSEHLVSGRVLVFAPRYPEIAYGEHLRVRGNLQSPGIIDGFSYADFLSISGIETVLYHASIERLGVSDHRSSLFESLFSLKTRFETAIDRRFPEPDASFLKGLLTGSRSGIPSEINDDFRTTGISHIVAISGFNITILIAIVAAALAFLPRRIAFFTAIGSIFLFTVFVGASASVVRAAIMGIIGLVALQAGRQQMALITLLFTACAMALYCPEILWYDVSFHLSFLAVVGLTFLSPLWRGWFAVLPSTLAVRESIEMTLAAQIAAAPIIALHFGQFSLIAPIANLLVVPTVPFAMLFGFLATTLGALFEPFFVIFGFLAHALLAYGVAVAHALASVPYASVPVSLPIVGFCAYYGILGFLVASIWRRKQFKG